MPAGGEEQIGVGGREGERERGGGGREKRGGEGEIGMDSCRERDIFELNGLGGVGGWELVIKLN